MPPSGTPFGACGTTFPPLRGGTMDAEHFCHLVIHSSGGEKPYNRPNGRWKCTPSVAFGDISPGGNAIKLREKRAKYVF